MRRSITVSTSVALLAAAAAAASVNGPNMFAAVDPTGQFRTFNPSGAIDFGNPFFQSLGTNGRSCASCHQPADGWTIVPSGSAAGLA